MSDIDTLNQALTTAAADVQILKASNTALLNAFAVVGQKVTDLSAQLAQLQGQQNPDLSTALGLAKSIDDDVKAVQQSDDAAVAGSATPPATPPARSAVIPPPAAPAAASTSSTGSDSSTVVNP